MSIRPDVWIKEMATRHGMIDPFVETQVRQHNGQAVVSYGLSSFGYLKHFPVDFLKIDGSFVKEILHDPIDREMVRSIKEIGHLTGKQTIAEWAETEEIVTMLKGMGVDFAQGYAIDEPRRIFEAGYSINKYQR